MEIPIKRGDIVVVDLAGAAGHEKQNATNGNFRPCLVVQNDVGNGVSPLTIIAPITDQKQGKNLPVQVPVTAGQLHTPNPKDSIIECGQIRTIDRDRRIAQRLGSIDPSVMPAVDQALRVSLSL